MGFPRGPVRRVGASCVARWEIDSELFCSQKKKKMIASCSLLFRGSWLSWSLELLPTKKVQKPISMPGATTKRWLKSDPGVAKINVDVGMLQSLGTMQKAQARPYVATTKVIIWVSQ